MTRDFRSMPSTYTPGSGMLEDDLVDWAIRYAEAHPATFGGAWVDWSSGVGVAVASFTNDLEAHRSALDPRIRIVVAAHPVSEVEAAVEEVRRFVEKHPAVRVLSVYWLRGSALHVEVVAEDEGAFERELRAAFGTAVAEVPVNLYFVQHGRVPESFDEWTVDSAGHYITVSWMGGGYQSDWKVDVEETDDEVRLTLSNVQVAQHRPADSNVGEEMGFGHTLEGHDREVTVELARPLGTRRVVDTERDEILDRPPVQRSWRKRRQDPDMRNLDAMEFVDSLNPEASASGTEYENGWVVIDANVDDPERLRAALVERFGEGYEVRARKDG